jgi:hypothetical protein
MLITPIAKKTAIFLAKILVLYLALIVLLIDRVLFATALPRFTFEQQPFFQSVVFTLAISAAISMVIRSKTPIIFTAFCLAYSTVFFVFPYQATFFIALFCVVAAVNFLYKNKVTEPLLVMLLIIAGVWVFISIIYPSYLIGWLNYVAMHKDLVSAILEGISAVKDLIFSSLIIIPVIGMYVLGKHSYANIYASLKSLRK